MPAYVVRQVGDEELRRCATGKAAVRRRRRATEEATAAGRTVASSTANATKTATATAARGRTRRAAIFDFVFAVLSWKVGKDQTKRVRCDRGGVLVTMKA